MTSIEEKDYAKVFANLISDNTIVYKSDSDFNINKLVNLFIGLEKKSEEFANQEGGGALEYIGNIFKPLADMFKSNPQFNDYMKKIIEETETNNKSNREAGSLSSSLKMNDNNNIISNFLPIVLSLCTST